ncbi:hypothetical protein GALL_245310 [mine drainage metagenome]|uniref:Uncharacterized protein n=1 Tax=mine drainage metagenome TaxID=410659 RepID=A0A1J5RVQ3_9ZZZZ
MRADHVARGHRTVQGVQRPHHLHHALAELHGFAHQATQTRLVLGRELHFTQRHGDVVLAEPVRTRPGVGGQEQAVHPEMRVSALGGPLRKFGVHPLALHHQRSHQADALVAQLAHELGDDGVLALRGDGHVAVRAVLRAELGIDQAHELVGFGQRAHRALAPAAAGALGDGHRGRNAEDGVDVGPRRRLHELAGVGVDRLQIAPLPLAEQHVEGQRTLAGPGHPGDHRHAAARQVHVDVLEVVLARVAYGDETLAAAPHGLREIGACLLGGLHDLRIVAGVGLCRSGEKAVHDARSHLPAIRRQRPPGMRCRASFDHRRRAGDDDLPAGVAPLGAEVDDPVGRGDHVQVVLDQHHAVPGVHQFVQGPQQLGDVVEVQAGGGFVQQIEAALARAAPGGLAGFGQEGRELEPLRLAARQRGRGLAQAQVIEADGLQHFEPRKQVAIGCENRQRLGHREFEHVGDVQLSAVGQRQLQLQHLGAVAPAVAIRTAQIDVGEELHLHVFEARAAAGRTTALAAVEAERSRGIAALLRRRQRGEALAQGVEGADEAHRVGTRRLAHGRLVDEHHVGHLLGAQQAVVKAGLGRGFAERARQRRVQHIAHQGGLAAARYAGDGHHGTQRKFGGDPTQVVFPRALQDEPGRGEPTRRVLARAARGTVGLHPPLAAQIGSGEGVRQAQAGEVALEHELAAVFAGAGPEFDQMVGGEHDLRVVLDHQQRIAGLLQAPHHAIQAMQVARMQADGRLVEHEKGLGERSAERGGEVDALHLAARKRARLPVERQVAQSHVQQIAQASADLVEQQAGRGIGSRLVLQRGEEILRTRHRQLHHVMQTEPRHGLHGGLAPRRARGAEARAARQRGVRRLAASDAPQQALGLEARATAGRAQAAAAVLGQQHAHMHLVGAGFQPVEKTAHAVVLLLPLPLPARVALDHPVAFGLGQFAPGHVQAHAGPGGVTLQVLLRVLETGGLPGLDGALAEALARVGNHQAPVDPQGAAKAAAGVAGAHRRVETEHARAGIAVGDVAMRAVQIGRIAPRRRGGLGAGRALRKRPHRRAPAAQAQRRFQGLGQARGLDVAGAKAVLHDVQDRIVASVDACVALGREPLQHVGFGQAGGDAHREGQHQARVARRRRAREHIGGDAGRAVAPHRLPALPAEQAGAAGVEQLEMVGQFGHRPHRGARGAHRVGLVDGDGRQDAADAVDLRPVHAVEELTRVGREGLDIAPLALGIDGVEHERTLAGPRDPGDHDDLPERDVQIEVLQVVLPRPLDLDGGEVLDGNDGVACGHAQHYTQPPPEPAGLGN